MNPTTQKPLILTIDDEDSVRSSIRDYLEDFDFHVLEARDGREGIKQLGLTSPDLVLVDLRMPEVDGLDVLAFVKEHTPDIPIIVVSGTGVIGDVIEALRCGAWDYLIKPIQDMAVLKHAVDRALERSHLLMEHQSYQAHLEQEVSARTAELIEQRDIVKRKAEEEAFIGALSRLSLQPLPLCDYLQEALVLLLNSVSWLQLLPRGGIFVTTQVGEEKRLDMVAQLGLEPKVQQQCRNVRFGDCLCGKAAETGKAQFASRADARHSRLIPGSPDHGHYNIPICHNDTVLGVLLLYLPAEHERRDDEVEFLERVSDVLSLGILRRKAEEEAEYLAYYDALTHLANRRLLMDHVAHELASAQRRGTCGALLFFDLDNFKHLNDALGHSAGDLLLQQVAERLRQRVRADDTLARLGGDEFVVLMPAVHHTDEQASFQAHLLAEELRADLATPYDMEGGEHHLTVSIGISLYPSDGNNAEDLLRHADAAMYVAKAEGRDSVRLYQPVMQENANSRLRLNTELRRALERGEFELHYQPKLDHKNQLTGAETLLRWRHPEQGILSPDRFIKLAEESALILPIGEWVLREACHQLQTCTKQHFNGYDFHLAVNVSPVQFRQREFVEVVERILKQTSIDPTRIILEITEGALTFDIDGALKKVRQLKGLGLGLAIDDFGTGYSSLARLKQLPLDSLKIDRSFVLGLPTDRNDAAIVDTIIAMAHRLSLSVTAEGVETQAQLQYLVEQGCRSFQGYLFSRPLPTEKFLRYCLDFLQTIEAEPQAYPSSNSDR